MAFKLLVACGMIRRLDADTVVATGFSRVQSSARSICCELKAARPQLFFSFPNQVVGLQHLLPKNESASLMNPFAECLRLNGRLGGSKYFLSGNAGR